MWSFCWMKNERAGIKMLSICQLLQFIANKCGNVISNLQNTQSWNKNNTVSFTCSFHQVINLKKWTAEMCALCLCLLIVIHYWSIFNSTLHHSLWHTCQISKGGKTFWSRSAVPLQPFDGCRAARPSQILSSYCNRNIFFFSRVLTRNTQLKGDSIFKTVINLSGCIRKGL